jgi:mannitol-specific phosphotransferase system IIBC component
MMALFNGNSGTITGTTTGTVLAIMININPDDIGKTIILSALGAVVSFLVSLGLKKLLNRKSG